MRTWCSLYRRVLSVDQEAEDEASRLAYGMGYMYTRNQAKEKRPGKIKKNGLQ